MSLTIPRVTVRESCSRAREAPCGGTILYLMMVAPRFPEVGVENWTEGGSLVQAVGLQKSAGHAMFGPTEANNRERG